jgi:hypothetical protein
MSRPARVDGRRAIEEAAKREAEAFRPNTKPIAIALAVNGLLAALCLGVPYYRGQHLAEHSLREFATFASCAVGGEPETKLGLALPPAERSQFADKVLHGDARWPQSCAGALHALMPEEAIFLWPSVKRAGADVRAAAGLVERELAALDKARKQGVTRVPERPLLAIGKLRAALTLLARAADVSDSLDEPSVRFTNTLTAIEPSRLPIMAGETAALDLWLRDEGLEALALDARGLSWLALDQGKIDRSRVKRSSLLRGTIRAPEPYGVLAMPEERCATDEHRCLRRATGIAAITHDALFEADQRSPLTPQWLASHPSERFDRSVRIDAVAIELLALADKAGGIALRRFARTVPEPAATVDQPDAADEGDKENAGPRPAAASDEWPIALEHTAGTALDALFVPARSAQNVAVARATEHGVEALLLDPRTSSRPPLALGMANGTAPFVTACRDAQPAGALDRAWLAFGSESELALVRVDGEAATTPLVRTALSIDAPIHATDPARDHVLVRCAGATSSVLVLTTQDELVAVLCEDARCEQRTISQGTDTFSAVLADTSTGKRLVIALSRKTDPSIAITTWQVGSAPSAPRVLSGCWDPAAGMCGAPQLASEGGHVLLAARERGDLRVIESRDAAQTWGPLADMVATTSTPLNSVMDQHRLRKGLDK